MFDTFVFVYFFLFFFQSVFHIVTDRFFSHFDAGHIGSASNQMAAYRSRDKEEDNGDDHLCIEDAFNQPKMDEGGHQYAENAKRRALGGGVCACVDIR